MISVLPCKDSAEIKKLFKKHNLEINDSSGCVIARTGEEVLGYCLYNLTEKTITVFAVEPQSDIMLADGILRSALHVAAENFVLDARYDDIAPEKLFELLGFITDKNDKKLNINKLFGGCGCKGCDNN